MSSPEQAPEPTMDEILASIRKIIADDEPEGAQQAEEAQQSGAGQPAPTAETGDAGAGGGFGQVPQTPGEEAAASQSSIDDEILELTNELSAQSQQPAQPQGDASHGAAPDASAPETPAPQAPQETASPAQTAHQPEQAGAAAGASDEDIVSALARAGIDQGGAQPPSAGEAENMPFPGGRQADEALAGGMAGDPESANQEPAAPAQSAPPGPSAASPEPGTEAPNAPSEASIDTGVYMPGEEDSLKTDQSAEQAASGFGQAEETAGSGDPASSLTETSGMAAAEAGSPDGRLDTASALAALEEASASSLPSQDNGKEGAEIAGVAAAEPASGAGKTLEESVKEMLRPMLREWLDNNMERIVEGAVRDELHSSGYGKSGS